MNIALNKNIQSMESMDHFGDHCFFDCILASWNWKPNSFFFPAPTKKSNKSSLKTGPWKKGQCLDGAWRDVVRMTKVLEHWFTWIWAMMSGTSEPKRSYPKWWFKKNGDESLGTIRKKINQKTHQKVMQNNSLPSPAPLSPPWPHLFRIIHEVLPRTILGSPPFSLKESGSGSLRLY